MSKFEGTERNNVITPNFVSFGVRSNPPGVTPSNADDYIDAGASDDTVDGGGGNDSIHGGYPETVDILEDQVTFPSGNDLLIGGDGNDFVVGYEDDDVIYGNVYSQGFPLFGPFKPPLPPETQPVYPPFKVSPSDPPVQLALFIVDNDTLLGESGDDQIFGQDGDDDIYGGDGNDILDGGPGNDIIDGDDGLGLFKGGVDIISGGSGNDLILGNAGDDFLNGDSGNDSIDGGSGDDDIDGGDGQDTVNGGANQDTYFLSDASHSPKGTPDTFIFKSGEDVIDLSGLVLGTTLQLNYVGINPFTAAGPLDVRHDVANKELQIDTNNDGEFNDGDVEIDGIVTIGANDLVLF